MSRAAAATAACSTVAGRLSAPAVGGSVARWTTTSTVLLTRLNVPVDRMITVALSSAVGEVSMRGRVMALRPVIGVSAAPLSLRTLTVNVPAFAVPTSGTFVSPATGTQGRALVAPASRLLQPPAASAMPVSRLKPRSTPASAR